MIPARVCIVGSGSAGRRHALAIRSLFPECEIELVRRFSSEQPLSELEQKNIMINTSLENALKRTPQFVVIASAATMHASDFESVARECDLVLLEKPIAETSAKAQLILETAQKRKTRVFIGHHLRVSDTVKKLQVEIQSKKLGELKSAHLEYGQHLEYWRKGINPQFSVTALSHLGGGVLRELSHEIDGILFLAGRPQEVLSATLKYDKAPTDNKVETEADFKIKASTFEAEIHLDMTSISPFRNWIFKFDHGILHADLLSGQITKQLYEKPPEKIFLARSGERDRAAVDLIRLVLSDESGSDQLCNLEEAVYILKVIETVERVAKDCAPSMIKL